MSHFLGNIRYFIVTVLWTMLSKDTFEAPSPPLSQRCPLNKTEWEDRAATIICQGNDVYHCLLAHDKVSVEERCVEKSLVLHGNCPFFNNQGYLHWAPCNDTDCPESSFVSNEVYQYPVCFAKTDNFIIHENFKQSNEGLGDSEIAGLVVGAVIAVAVFAVACIYFLVYRKGQDEEVANGANALRSKDLVYVVGKLGNSVSTAGKNIASHFASKNQMQTKFLNYLSLSNDFEFSENTVYFIDGWFGLWNINPCEESEVRKSLHLLSEEIKSTKKAKFVIGVRTEVLKYYDPVFESSGVAYSDYEAIYLESSSEQREKSIEKHFRKIQRKCGKAECPCKKIEVEKIKKVKEIGTHLTLKLLELDHDLGNVIIDKDSGPIVAMKGHFKALKLKDKNLFAAILYIVLNGFYDEDNFKESIAEKFNITKSNMAQKSLKEYTIRIKSAKGDSKQQHTLAPMWSSKITADRTQTKSAVVFWHNFLYISAFHACYDESDEKEKMMLYCNLDAILQLVRPVGQGSYFTVEADLDSISTFYENRIKGKEIEEHVKEHPLILYLREKKPIQI